eukprot:366167-Chlamydomonas_euryale.AAC.11
MSKFGGSFPTRHLKGAESVLLPKCSDFFAYRSFPCYFPPHNSLCSLTPRRFSIACQGALGLSHPSMPC